MNLKCNMCGGSLHAPESGSIVQCEYCGSSVTLPRVDDERVARLYNRANQLRMQKDFDKAELAYESISLERPDDAEAHWCAMLCRYGVEYVEDPENGARLPTLRRMQFEPVLEDADYLRALKCADPGARALYESEAERISVIQRRYLEISSREKPFDVFICYKETNEYGERTPDSVYAQEIYDLLTGRGHHVFFARVTLEHKLGEAYEPYIFTALNSAKVMLAVGTRASYLQSEWVSNEWKRYLYLMESDPGKRLIPVYCGMDACELPDEFAYFQALDYGKINARQNLLRGVEKFIGAGRERAEGTSGKDEAPAPAERGPAPQAAPRDEVAPLMRRAELFLEDCEPDDAEAYFDRVLDLAPEYAPAYMGRVRVRLLRLEKERLAEGIGSSAGSRPLGTSPFCLEDDPDYCKALRFSSKEEAERFSLECEDRLNQIEQKVVYQEVQKLLEACGHRDVPSLMRAAEKREPLIQNAGPYRRAAELCRSIPRYREADVVARCCERLAKVAEQRPCYESGVARMKNASTLSAFEAATKDFANAGDYRDAPERLRQCREKAEKLGEAAYAEACEALRKASTAQDFANVQLLFKALSGVRDVSAEVEGCKRQEEERRAREEREKDERWRRETLAFRRKETFKRWFSSIFAIVAFGGFVAVMVFTLYVIPSGHYREAEKLLEEGRYEEASEAFNQARGYSGANERVGEPYYLLAEKLLAEGKWEDASAAFKQAGECVEKESADDPYSALAKRRRAGKRYDEESAAQEQAGKYSDAMERVGEPYYLQAQELLAEGKYGEASAAFKQAGEYGDAGQRVGEPYYVLAEKLLAEGKWEEAVAAFEQAGEYGDAATRRAEQFYLRAKDLLADKKYVEASEAFKQAGEYSDAAQRVGEPYYLQAEELLSQKQYAEASEAFAKAGEYGNASKRVGEPYYIQAKELLAAKQYAEASEAFKQAGGYGDAARRVGEPYYIQAEELWGEGKAMDAATAFRSAGEYRDAALRAQRIFYAQATELLASGRGFEAARAYRLAGDYADAEDRVARTYYAAAEKLLEQGQYRKAAWAFMRAEGYPDALKRAYEIEYEHLYKDRLAIGSHHVVAVRWDGAVVVAGRNENGRCNVAGWEDIVAVAAGDMHSLGLKADGTVVSTGSNDNLQCGLSGHKKLVALKASALFSAGIFQSGALDYSGHHYTVVFDAIKQWEKPIVDLSVQEKHIVALKPDGTAIAAGSNILYGQCNVESWEDIVEIATGTFHTVGLKADGTVVAVGDNRKGQCEVGGWRDIVAIAAGGEGTVGLKADGTVVAAGFPLEAAHSGMSGWRDVAAVFVGDGSVLGLRTDGTVLCSGVDEEIRELISTWNLLE